MKILEITTVMRGGAGMFLVKLAQALLDKSHQVEVISTGQSGELVDWEELLKELDRYNIPHYNLNFFKRDNDIFWTEVKNLSELLKERHYDIIHVQAGVPAYAAYAAKTMAQLDIPIIATFHSWGKDRPEWMNIVDAWSFNQCNSVFFDSYEYMAFGKSKGITANSDVIYPGLYVDPEKYLPFKKELRKRLNKELGLPEHVRIITHLGEITERKGQLDLIKAINEIDDICLLLIGECRNQSYQEQINRYIDENKLKPKIKELGWVNDPYKIIAASDLFIFPSYSEGLGLAPLEAMTLEVPTIFSLVEGTKDIADVLGKSTFGTFAPGDYGAISDLIKKVFNLNAEFTQKVASTAAKRSMEIFGFKQTIHKYENAMFQEVNNSKASISTIQSR